MKQLRIEDVVDFRRLDNEARLRYAAKMRNYVKSENDDGGGDYWVSCSSAIINALRFNDLEYIYDKISDLALKCDYTDRSTTKGRYIANMTILRKFANSDLSKFLPDHQIESCEQKGFGKIVPVNGLQLKIKPSYVYSFKNDGVEEVGAIYLVVKKDGVSYEELGMFSEILYQYLHTHYAEDYVVNPKYCIAVDAFKVQSLSYEQLQTGKVQQILHSTAGEFAQMLNK